MKRREFMQITTASATAALVPERVYSQKPTPKENVTRKLFIYGGQLNSTFVQYMAGLTSKKNPKICFLPTATGDSANYIAYWFQTVQDLDVKPYVVRTFINSASHPRSFESLLTGMDAIVVGGGNTLNMLAIWKAQGIDVVLRKAYDSGIVIGGGSAGSLCWFQNGMTDSRPTKLTRLEGLGWISGSHCPHYNTEKERRPLYQETILKKEISPGYACDELAGIYFENENFVRSVSKNQTDKSYYIDLVDGKILEKELKTELIAN